MSRKSDTRMKPETGESREAKIAALVAAGLSNDGIWAAMEVEYPQTIKDDKRRKAVAGKVIDYDAKEREKLGWAIRSVKGLMIKDDEDLNELLTLTGTIDDMDAIDDVPYENRSRFSSGIPAIDYIYGTTHFRYTEDDPKGRWKKGDYRPWKPTAGNWVSIHDDAYTEVGFPQGYMALWGGAPGVGKTRLAIAVTKALNSLGQRVLYFNGEAEKSDFRSWVGTDVDGDLFKVYSSEIVRTEKVVEMAYKYPSPVIIVDSFQMLAEVQKGNRGAKTALSRFKLLKADPAAGKPNIIFICQLNKAGQLAGSRYLEHMVDGSISVRRFEGHDDQFIFGSMKMRGAPAPREVIFKHTSSGVECVSTQLRTGPAYKLVQPSATPAIQQGVVDPADMAPEPKRRRGEEDDGE